MPSFFTLCACECVCDAAGTHSNRAIGTAGNEHTVATSASSSTDETYDRVDTQCQRCGRLLFMLLLPKPVVVSLPVVYSGSLGA